MCYTQRKIEGGVVALRESDDAMHNAQCTMQALCNLMANLEISMSMGTAHYVVCMVVDW